MMIQAGADRWGHQLICKIIEDRKIDTMEAMRKLTLLLRAGAHVNVDGARVNAINLPLME